MGRMPSTTNAARVTTCPVVTLAALVVLGILPIAAVLVLVLLREYRIDVQMHRHPKSEDQ